MTGYTKLFGTIIASTIWTEDDKTRLVWITMLAMANKHGEVEASIPGLAKFANVSIADTESALKKLLAADKYSRSKEFDGRRIEVIDGGWEILNHAKYREKASDEDRREQSRIRVKRFRERNAEVTQGNAAETPDSLSREQIAEANSESEEKEGQDAVPEKFVEVRLWNAKKVLPQVKSVSSGRATAIRARRRDQFWADNFSAALDKIISSEFCMGKNDRGWRADFDFVLRPDSVAKVMEGKYDNRVQNPKSAGWGKVAM